LDIAVDTIIAFLREDCNSINALLNYMQHVVETSRDRTHHCLLAKLYIDVLDADEQRETYEGFVKQKEKTSFKSYVDGLDTVTSKRRIRGLEYLASPNSLYDCDVVIGGNKGMEMCVEEAAVYEHQGEWTKVVRALVKARDAVGAEEAIGRAPDKSRPGLIAGLIKLYINPEFGYQSTIPLIIATCTREESLRYSMHPISPSSTSYHLSRPIGP
jgi:hypothetical protein